MQMLRSNLHRVSAVPALLALAVLLAGCASKNPLIDDAGPTMAAAPEAKADSAKASSPTGVQTIKEKRFLGFFSPYRPDIQQGNFVSQEMVSQLKEGMTRDQVVFILGTPLLTDMFHSDRWDYPFRLKKGNGEITTSRVSVFFADNKVSRFEGGDLPTEADYLSRISGKGSSKKVPANVEPASPVPAPASTTESGTK